MPMIEYRFNSVSHFVDMMQSGWTPQEIYNNSVTELNHLIKQLKQERDILATQIQTAEVEYANAR